MTSPGKRVISVSAISLLALTGCAMPSEPVALPSNFIPPAHPQTSSPPNDGVLTPEGFTASDQMTLRVRNVGCGKTVETGTGFAIDENTVLTNRHVVMNASEIELDTFDYRRIKVAEALITDIADIAILKTEDPLDGLPELRESDPEIGQAVSIVGYPLGNEITTTDGVVLGMTSDPLGLHDKQVFATDAVVDHGSSGSAVLDEDGGVVGVVYAKNGAGQAFFIPISTVQDLLEDEADFEAAPTCQLPTMPTTLAPAPTLDPSSRPEPVETEQPTDPAAID